jgi:hypothetical protein
MAQTKRFATFLVAFIVPLIVFFGVVEQGRSDTNSLEVICRIPAITTGVDNDSFVVPLILTNNMAADSVGGCEILINITDPELIRFDVDSTWWLLDSTCMGYDGGLCTLWQYDSVIQLGTSPFDREGTLTENWEYLETRVIGGDGGVIKISGLADQIAPPYTPGFPQGTDTLIKLFAHTNGSLGDSLCDSVSVELRISRSETRFSNSQGDLIGCGSYEWNVDTFYFNCAEWMEDSCLAWFDTLYDSTYDCILDTTRVVLVNSDAVFECCNWIPGDADSNGIWNISDAVYLIAYIFGGGQPPQPDLLAGDADCNGIVNISDAVFLIAYIFGGGGAPNCDCDSLLSIP